MLRVAVLLLSVLAGLWASGPARADDETLIAHFRQRPPEMVLDGERMYGPLKDILEEAVDTLGYRLDWRYTPFARSKMELEHGFVDLVPRVFRTTGREAYIHFLGPIGYQRKDILFLVRKGREGSISRYEDLRDKMIAVKRGTYYFDRFNDDETLSKVLVVDDLQIVQHFAHNRVDVAIIVDRPAIEEALKQQGVRNYAFADYIYANIIGNYYGMSKKTPHAPLHQRLSEILVEMRDSGRVGEIYRAHGVVPPKSSPEAAMEGP